MEEAQARGSHKERGGSQKSGVGSLISASRTTGQTVMCPELPARHEQ